MMISKQHILAPNTSCHKYFQLEVKSREIKFRKKLIEGEN
jgi:hypothetical protein